MAVTIVDLPTSAGALLARELGEDVRFPAADVQDSAQMEAALDVAASFGRPSRAVVHCTGSGGPVRVLDHDGNPGSLEKYEEIVRLNLVAASTYCAWPPRAWPRPRGARRGGTHRLDRRLRRADRADSVCGLQGRRGRHDPGGRATWPVAAFA